MDNRWSVTTLTHTSTPATSMRTVSVCLRISQVRNMLGGRMYAPKPVPKNASLSGCHCSPRFYINTCMYKRSIHLYLGSLGAHVPRCAQFDQRKAKHIAGCLHLHNSLQCSHRHLRIPLGAKRARGGRTSLNRAPPPPPPPLNTEVFRCTHYLLPSISVC